MTQVSVSDAKAQLTDLVRRAEAGEDIVLTRHGHPTVRLVPTRRVLSREEKHAALEALYGSAAGKFPPGETAARSQDFLYDENGLPG